MFVNQKAADRYFDAYDTILREWPVPAEELDIDTRFGATRVRRSGTTGPPIVLLAGYKATSLSWRQNVEELAVRHQVYAALAPYTSSKLLATLENNRIALYTRVLQMQYEMAGYADDHDRLAETISAQRHELDRLRDELDGAHGHVAALQQEIERLRETPRPEPTNNFGHALTQLGRVAAAQVRKSLH
ncbi:hypothetical protein ACFQ1S_11135 [Kibdelosporangium lantanae]|uniref:Uncharacterized protein n=1 Tax=Kibdelosporangium lantanae TaxID=1497396 RepID=A0ABW3M7T5_9PSEU